MFTLNVALPWFFPHLKEIFLKTPIRFCPPPHQAKSFHFQPSRKMWKGWSYDTIKGCKIIAKTKITGGICTTKCTGTTECRCLRLNSRITPGTFGLNFLVLFTSPIPNSKGLLLKSKFLQEDRYISYEQYLEYKSAKQHFYESICSRERFHPKEIGSKY